MRLLGAAAVIALLTGPAYAQVPNINLIPETQSKTPEEKEAEAERDRKYRELTPENPRRQGLQRSVGHGAQHRYAEGSGPRQAAHQDRQHGKLALPFAAEAPHRRGQPGHEVVYPDILRRGSAVRRARIEVRSVPGFVVQNLKSAFA